MSTREGNANNYLLYSGLQRLGTEVFSGFTLANAKAADICHLHWPEYAAVDENRGTRIVRMGKFFAQLCVLKFFGVKLAWTVHNLYPHDVPPRRSMRLFYYALFHFLDGLIFLTYSSRDLCHGKYPESRSCPDSVIPECHYRTIFFEAGKPSPGPKKRLSDVQQFLRFGTFRQNARKEQLILFFGVIRRYKCLERLFDAFDRLPRDNVRLICAGAPFENEQYMSEIRRLAAKNSRIGLRLEWISLKETAALFNRAMLVVVPYRELNSGIPLLSLSLNRPVLGPDTESIVEMQGVVGRDWIMTYDGELTPELLSSALDWAAARTAAEPDLTTYESGDITRRTLDFYGDLCGKPAMESERRG